MEAELEPLVKELVDVYLQSVVSPVDHSYPVNDPSGHDSIQAQLLASEDSRPSTPEVDVLSFPRSELRGSFRASPADARSMRTLLDSNNVESERSPEICFPSPAGADRRNLSWTSVPDSVGDVVHANVSQNEGIKDLGDQLAVVASKIDKLFSTKIDQTRLESMLASKADLGMLSDKADVQSLETIQNVLEHFSKELKSLRTRHVQEIDHVKSVLQDTLRKGLKTMLNAAPPTAGANSLASTSGIRGMCLSCGRDR
jgi:hypothetical protein